MAFNHYAKLKRLLEAESPTWVIRRIDEPTSVKNFRGEVVRFEHYYRLYRADGSAIKYGKFQQIERLAKALNKEIEDLPIVN